MVNIIPDSQIIRWHELAAVIEASGDLNTTDIQYIQYFKVVYHCFACDIFPGNDTNVQEAVKILKKKSRQFKLQQIFERRFEVVSRNQ